jgi:hypothetical protein
MREVFAIQILVIGLLVTTTSPAEAPLWQIANPVANRGSIENQTEAYFANKTQALRALLENAPAEFSGDNSYIISLPLPDGSQSRFSVLESPVMAAALAATQNLQGIWPR